MFDRSVFSEVNFILSFLLPLRATLPTLLILQISLSSCLFSAHPGLRHLPVTNPLALPTDPQGRQVYHCSDLHHPKTDC